MIFKKYKLLKEENKSLKETISMYENTKLPVFKATNMQPIRFVSCIKYDPMLIVNEAERSCIPQSIIKERYINEAKEKLAEKLMQQAIRVEEDCYEPMIVAYINVVFDGEVTDND
jgi:hypothetical protein